MAVLLNSFIMSAEKAETRERKEALDARKIVHILDPLMSSLTQDYVDDADLSDRLRLLFDVIAVKMSLSMQFLIFLLDKTTIRKILSSNEI